MATAVSVGSSAALPHHVLARVPGDASPERRAGSKIRKAEKTGGNRVLMFGANRELAMYRAEVLRQRGYEVFIAGDVREAMETMQPRNVDVVVVTYTLPSAMVEEIVELLSQFCPDCRLITIAQSSRPDPRIPANAVVEAGQGPKALIEALDRVLNRRLS